MGYLRQPSSQTIYNPGGSGGGSGFDGVVNTFDELPEEVPPDIGEIWVVRTSTGIWPINYHSRGLYQRVADTGVRETDWEFLSDLPATFSDLGFEVYHEGAPSKALKFDLGSLTGTRTFQVPDSDGTLIIQGAITGSGLTMATSRILGRTTAAAGAIEEISVGSSLSLSAGVLNAIQDIRMTATPQFSALHLGADGTESGLLAVYAQSAGDDATIALQDASSGNFTFLQASLATANRTITLPNNSGTIALLSDIPSVTPSALTRVNDTNVTLTLGGSPSVALLAATSLTLGWTGTLAVGRGGTGVGTLGDITRVNDTNVTLALGGTPTGAVINSTSFTLGWTGTLAVGRGGTGVGSLGNITRVNDTNVTLTLGGTPTGAVINSTSFTMGWTGALAADRGGTGLIVYTTGDILVATGATTLAGLNAVAVGQVLVSAGVGTAPAWSANPRLGSLGVGVAAESGGPILRVTNNTGGLPTAYSTSQVVMHVGNTDAAAPAILIDGSGGSGLLELRRANGTLASPTQLTNGTIIGTIGWRGYGTTVGYTNRRAEISAVATEDWTNTANGSKIVFNVTAATTTTTAEAMSLTSASLTVVPRVTAPSATLSSTGTGALLVGGATDDTIHAAYIIGYIRIQNSSDFALNGYAGNTLKGQFYYNAVAGDIRMGAFSNEALVFITNNVVRVTISNAGALRFHAYGAGALTTDASGNVTAVSDARCKDVLGDSLYGLKEIMALRPKLFKWNVASKLSRDEVNVGFIAQDVAPVIPEAVGRDGRGYMTFGDRPILAAVVSAVQELANRLEKVEQKVLS